MVLIGFLKTEKLEEVVKKFVFSEEEEVDSKKRVK